MKKRIKLVFAIIILCLSILSINVQANNENTLTIKGNDNIKSGEELILTINLSGDDKGILGMQGTLKYNKEVFELVDTKIQKEDWNITIFNKETGTFMLETTDEKLYDNQSYIYTQEDIMEIKLKAKEGTKIKNEIIEIENVKVVNGDFETIQITDISNKTINKSGDYKTIILTIIAILIVIIIIRTIKNKRKI